LRGRSPKQSQVTGKYEIATPPAIGGSQ